MLFRSTLTLAFGDAEALLPRLTVTPDALFLDGFAPSKNPQMWTPGVFKALSRKAGPDTTLATYTTAAAVRHGLEREGFVCERRTGFGRKREMLVGRFAPRWPVRAKLSPGTRFRPRQAIVIGAGLAGAALCERLISRSWQVTLIDAANAPATGASGLHAGSFHPHISPDDCLLSRLARNAFLQALSRWHRFEAQGIGFERGLCGVLQLPHHAREEEAMRNRGFATLIHFYNQKNTTQSANILKHGYQN